MLQKERTRKKGKDLIKNIEILESNLSESSGNSLDALKDISIMSLSIIRKNKMQGILIRSRTQITEDDEKPSHYFCNLEKHNYNSKIIPKLERKDGKVITDQFEILNDAKMFYEDLYSNKDNNLTDIDLDSLFINTNIRKLNTEESNKLEGLLTYKEASLTLKTMANNRSPGSDGFGADFFKMFWNNLGHFIVRSLNFGFLKGELSITQREGIITCIPKENKPRHYITNYRPISLLNCIYKIASGIIANRIKGTLQKLIHTDQTGFIAGKYIGENTRLVYDTMHHTEIKSISGLLLLVDFEKAFDSVSWAFIYKVLKFYGFGNSLILWIKVLNQNAMLTVNQGGNLTFFTYRPWLPSGRSSITISICSLCGDFRNYDKK